ncbi:MAG TPA: hypothetical protein VFX59_26920 [Polyangiales bacterium]|nr:hypothetical protein [Polyangiales bacterium]
MSDTQKSASGRGDFFAVDRRCFAKVCVLGLNAAVAYLVLARFSRRDNVNTSASVHAIETYTGVSRGRAGQALQALVDSGFVNVLQAGTKPRYEITPYAELPGAAPPPMTPEERLVYESIKAGNASVPRGADPLRRTVSLSSVSS